MRLQRPPLLWLLLAAVGCDTSLPPPNLGPGPACRGPLPVWVDQDCARLPCVIDVVRDDACTLSVRLAACLAPPPRLELPVDGEPILRGAMCQVLDERALDPPPAWAVRCENVSQRRCNFRVYTQTTALGLIEQRVRVAPDPRPTSPIADSLAGLYPFFGYIADAEAIQGRLYLLTHGRRRVTRCEDDESWLEIRELDTGALLSSVRMPRCTTRIAPDAPGFVAAYADGDQVRVGRFSLDGTQLTASPPLTRTSTYVPRCTVLRPAARGRWLVTAVQQRGTEASVIALLDPSLTQVETSTRVEGQLVDAIETAGGAVLALDSDRRRVLAFAVGLAGAPVVNLLPLGVRLSEAADPGLMLALPERGLFVFGTLGQTGGVSSLPLDAPRAGLDSPISALAQKKAVGAWALTRDPRREDRVLVGLLDARSSAEELSGAPAVARLALLGTDPLRFLPSTLEVGEGAIIRIIPADATHVWVVLGWTGELVRVRLAP